ncbi:uncharacterized protein ACIB01_013751 [Guaruba guarouba]
MHIYGVQLVPPSPSRSLKAGPGPLPALAPRSAAAALPWLCPPGCGDRGLRGDLLLGCNRKAAGALGEDKGILRPPDAAGGAVAAALSSEPQAGMGEPRLRRAGPQERVGYGRGPRRFPPPSAFHHKSGFLPAGAGAVGAPGGKEAAPAWRRELAAGAVLPAPPRLASSAASLPSPFIPPSPPSSTTSSSCSSPPNLSLQSPSLRGGT